jgi:hypothetical protein
VTPMQVPHKLLKARDMMHVHSNVCLCPVKEYLSIIFVTWIGYTAILARPAPAKLLNARGVCVKGHGNTNWIIFHIVPTTPLTHPAYGGKKGCQLTQRNCRVNCQ